MRAAGPRFTAARGSPRIWHDRARVAVLLASAWAVALALAPAGPQPLAQSITVSGDVDCIEPGLLARRVASWSGHRTVPPGVAIAVEHAPHRLALRISGLTTTDVVRSFEPPPARCRDAEIAVAVALAVALDGEAVAERLALPVAGLRGYDGPTAVPADAATPEPERTAAARRVDAERRIEPAPRAGRGTPQVELALAAGGSIGVLVRAGFESLLELRLRWRPFALVLGADVGARRNIALGTSGGVVDVVRGAARLGLCLPVDRGRLTLALCAAGSAGTLQADPRRTVRPRRSTVPWAAIIGGLEGAMRLSPRWALVLKSDVVFAFVRPAIVATDLQTTVPIRLSTPAVGWRGLLGVAVRLGRVAHPPR